MVIYHFVYPLPGQPACASSPSSVSFLASFSRKLCEDLKGRRTLPTPLGLALSSISMPNLYFGTVVECINGSIQVDAYAIAAKGRKTLENIALVQEYVAWMLFGFKQRQINA